MLLRFFEIALHMTGIVSFILSLVYLFTPWSLWLSGEQWTMIALFALIYVVSITCVFIAKCRSEPL